MKAAFIYTGSSPQGGTALYLKNLFKYVGSPEVRFSLISVGHWEWVHDIQNFGGHVDMVGGFWGMLYRIKKEKPDILITGGLKSNFYGRIASLLTGVKVITTVHSDYRYDYHGFKRIMYLILDRALRFRTAKYIPVSSYLKERLVQEGISAEKIAVVYNGIDFQNSVVGRLDGSAVVIGSMGRLHKTKGFDLLIQAAKHLPKNVKVKIWGEGAEKETLEQLIKEEGLSDRAAILNWEPDVNKILSQVDVYVQSSRMEGFGLALAQAMAAGIPVVVTPVGALPELVTNNKTGLVAKTTSPQDIADAISKLLEDPTNSAELGRKAAISVRERFSIEGWADLMTQEIKDLK